MINKVSRPLRPIVSRQRRLSGVSVPEPRQDGLGGDDLFIYLFYSGRGSSAGEVYLFMLFFFFPETSQAIRPHVAQQRVASQQLSERVTAI